MDGKVQSVVFKVFAIVSALAIGGGYISWRGAEAEKESQRKSAERAKAKVEKEEIPETLIVGSKSIDAVFSTRQAESMAEKDSILPELEGVEEAPGQELLPSSKVLLLRLPEKEADPAKKKDPKLLPSSKSIDSILDGLVPENPE